MGKLIIKLFLIAVCLIFSFYGLFVISFKTVETLAKGIKHNKLQGKVQSYSSDDNTISIVNRNYQTQEQSVSLNTPVVQATPVPSPQPERVVYQTIFRTVPQTPPSTQPVYQQINYQQAAPPVYQQPPPQQTQPTYVVVQQPPVQQRPAQIVYVTPQQTPAPTPQQVIYQPVAAATPQPVIKVPVVYQEQPPVIQPVATATSSANVKELPKTGLPIAAWSLGGLIPAGWGLLKFRKGNKETLDNPNFIWEKRQFTKED
jgi:hypothetical protein